MPSQIYAPYVYSNVQPFAPNNNYSVLCSNNESPSWNSNVVVNDINATNCTLTGALDTVNATISNALTISNLTSGVLINTNGLISSTVNPIINDLTSYNITNSNALSSNNATITTASIGTNNVTNETISNSLTISNLTTAGVLINGTNGLISSSLVPTITTLNSTNIVNSADVQTLNCTVQSMSVAGIVENSSTGLLSTTMTPTITTLNSTNINNSALVTTANTTITSLTSTSILQSSSTGVISCLGNGTAGQILISNGTNVPSFQNNNASMVLLQSVTASNVANINLTPSSSYNNHVLVISNMLCATGGNAYIQFYEAGTTNAMIVASYWWACNTLPYDSTMTNNYSTSDIGYCFKYALQNTVNTSLNGQIELYNLSTCSTTIPVFCSGKCVWNADLSTEFSTASNSTIMSPITIVRITMASGNILSGTFSLYGYNT